MLKRPDYVWNDSRTDCNNNEVFSIVSLLTLIRECEKLRKIKMNLWNWEISKVSLKLLKFFSDYFFFVIIRTITYVPKYIPLTQTYKSLGLVFSCFLTSNYFWLLLWSFGPTTGILEPILSKTKWYNQEYSFFTTRSIL